jgi:hypothetical protein
MVNSSLPALYHEMSASPLQNAVPSPPPAAADIAAVMIIADTNKTFPHPDTIRLVFCEFTNIAILLSCKENRIKYHQ